MESEGTVACEPGCSHCVYQRENANLISKFDRTPEENEVLRAAWVEIQQRPVHAAGMTTENSYAFTGERNRHCYDAEKCNADTFCDCVCVRCMRVKRGEFQTR